MFEVIKLSEGMILLIVIWIVCTIATATTKENYIETAVTLTILYVLYRFFL